MTSTTQCQIVAGPSREELFDALRLRHEGREVTFTVAPQTPQAPTSTKPEIKNLLLKVQVNGLSIEDGSGNNWLFKLYDRQAILGSQYLDGYINVTRRKGWVRPTTS